MGHLYHVVFNLPHGARAGDCAERGRDHPFVWRPGVCRAGSGWGVCVVWSQCGTLCDRAQEVDAAASVVGSLPTIETDSRPTERIDNVYVFFQIAKCPTLLKRDRECASCSVHLVVAF